jgi:hypothetical protein
VAAAKAADRGVARHGADGLPPVRQQQCARARTKYALLSVWQKNLILSVLYRSCNKEPRKSGALVMSSWYCFFE